jgi:hypothetical protein
MVMYLLAWNAVNILCDIYTSLSNGGSLTRDPKDKGARNEDQAVQLSIPRPFGSYIRYSSDAELKRKKEPLTAAHTHTLRGCPPREQIRYTLDLPPPHRIISNSNFRIGIRMVTTLAPCKKKFPARSSARKRISTRFAFSSAFVGSRVSLRGPQLYEASARGVAFPSERLSLRPRCSIDARPDLGRSGRHAKRVVWGTHTPNLQYYY